MTARRLLWTATFAVLMMLGPAAIAAATPPKCVGDCDGGGDVTVDEIVTMVATALSGGSTDSCKAGDMNGSGSITVDEVITAVANALGGCSKGEPTATAVTSQTPTPGDTATPALTQTAEAAATETPESEETETAAPTETETLEPLETETPGATRTGGMIPLTTTPGVAPTDTPQPNPSETAVPEPTKTPEPEPTETQPQPTASAAAAPTETPEPPPTDTPGSNGGGRIDLGSTPGSPGGIVVVAANLSGGNNLLTATSTDVIYDTTRVNVVQSGGIACTVNPAIGQATSYGKMLLVSVRNQTATTARLRVGVIAFTNPSAIPDGLLFTCQFQISADAQPGAIVLENQSSASGAETEAVSLGGSNGMIVVQ